MSETEASRSSGGAIHVLPANSQARHSPLIMFTRRELAEILTIYGRKVADGEWRDYAIDQLRDRCVFSVYRRTSEYPLFRIEKVPKLARKQGVYSVVATGGTILKRGHQLSQVLRIFEKRRLAVVD